MKAENREKVEEQAMEILESAKSLDVGSTAYEKAVKTANEMLDRVSAEEKFERDLAEKAKNREEDKNEALVIREEEQRAAKKKRILDVSLRVTETLVSVGVFVAGLVFKSQQREKICNWEQTGNFASSQTSKDVIREATK